MSLLKVCDYCGSRIQEPFSNYRCDLDNDCLAIMEILVISLNSTKDYPKNPDLCRSCIKKALEN